MGKVILVTSGKGGTGKTTFAVNLGCVFANTGAKVVIADFNIGLRNDDIYLGTENSILFDLCDVVNGVCSLEKAIVPCDCCDGLYLISGPQYKAIENLGEEHIKLIVERLKYDFDYVFIDCPVNDGKLLSYVANYSDSALLVMTQDYVALRNTDAISERLFCCGLEDRCVVINKIIQDDSDKIPSFDEIISTLDIPLVGMVCYDLSLHYCNNSGTPLIKGGSPFLLKTFIEIASRLV